MEIFLPSVRFFIFNFINLMIIFLVWLANDRKFFHFSMTRAIVAQFLSIFTLLFFGNSSGEQIIKLCCTLQIYVWAYLGTLLEEFLYYSIPQFTSGIKKILLNIRGVIFYASFISSMLPVFGIIFAIGSSMEPNLSKFNLVIVDNYYYGVKLFNSNWIVKRFESPKGDIVGINFNDKSALKRVLALEGDTVSIVNGRAYVNNEGLHFFKEDGFMLEEIGNNSYIIKVGGNNLDIEFENLKVPKGKMFVIGDNRPVSIDSRLYGFVPVENITGKCIACVISV